MIAVDVIDISELYGTMSLGYCSYTVFHFNDHRPLSIICGPYRQLIHGRQQYTIPWSQTLSVKSVKIGKVR